MKVKIKKYGRWNETCNWQLEGVTEKDLPEETVNNLEFAGYTYNNHYNEYHLKRDDNHMTVVTVM